MLLFFQTRTRSSLFWLNCNMAPEKLDQHLRIIFYTIVGVTHLEATTVCNHHLKSTHCTTQELFRTCCWDSCLSWQIVYLHRRLQTKSQPFLQPFLLSTKKWHCKFLTRTNPWSPSTNFFANPRHQIPSTGNEVIDKNDQNQELDNIQQPDQTPCVDSLPVRRKV